MRRNRQKEKTLDASGHMAAAPGVCCYLFVLVCEIEFLAVIVRIRHTFQLGKGLLGQRPHIPVHTRHGCGDLAYGDWRQQQKLKGLSPVHSTEFRPFVF